MNSTLTVADLRIIIGALFATADFIPYLNQAMNALLLSGRWNGSTVFVTFSSSTGFITLPYQYLAVLGVNTGAWIPPIFSQNHMFIESGPGRIEATSQASSMLIDMGDGFCTTAEPPVAGSTMRIVLDNAADIGKIIRFYGYSDGVEISGSTGRGVSLTTTGLTTNLATTFDLNAGRAVTGIECPVDASGFPSLTYGWKLYSVAPTTGTATLLGTYQPQDMRPSYRRYQTGVITAPSDGSPAIQLLCQRRFIKAYKETDFIWPDNVQAIKSAMQGVQDEDSGNYEASAPAWERAYAALELELKSKRGGIMPVIPFNKMPAPRNPSFAR